MMESRELLKLLLTEHDAQLSDDERVAFLEMHEDLDARVRRQLSPKQERWVRTVAERVGADAPDAENLFSNMTEEQKRKHVEQVRTRLPWETGAMVRPAKPPGERRGR